MRSPTAALALLALLALLSVPGCAAGPEAGDAELAQGEDARIIAQLAEIAPRDSGIPGTGADAHTGAVTATECWNPSANMLDAETFRVLCRLHFAEADTERYRDMICIGKVTEDPVTEYCYPWAYYSEMPRYEDQTGYRAS
ncbi:hypothetical protein [Leucobacter sp. W1038]|uniref:hypothetical protein n=1 Tax=Leucobacter sp. W1038 TaxID=3438281 RepID=UPI003D975CAB